MASTMLPMPLYIVAGVEDLQGQIKQDFWEGAKVLPRQQELPSVPIAKDDPLTDVKLKYDIDIDDLLPFDELSFPSVDLLNPEHLFPDLLPFGSKDQSALCDVAHNGAQPFRAEPNDALAPKPLVTIKLKKIVCPKIKANSLTNPKNLKIFNTDMTISKNRQSSYESANEITDDYAFSSERFVPPASDPLTLKEALDLENADLILDSYFSPSSVSSPGTSVASDMDVEGSSATCSAHSPVTLLDCLDDGFDFQFVDDASYPATRLEEERLSFADNEGVSIKESHKSSFSAVDGDLSDNLPVDPADHDTAPRETPKRRKGRQKFSSDVRYLRKKAQNKEAACRYRQKKRLEHRRLVDSVREAETRHVQLVKQGASLRQELDFVKKILREILVAKNVVSPATFS